MKSAAKAFYEYCQDSTVQKELRAYPSSHLMSIVQNVVNQTLDMSADVHTTTMLNAKSEYRWNVFDFMLKMLINLRQDSKLHKENQKFWPGLKKLEALPALGWEAYKQLATESYDSNSLLGSASVSRRVGCKVIFDVKGPKEIVCWQRIDWKLGYYMERMPLERIVSTPKTLGEEIKVLGDWLRQAGQAVEVFYARDYETFFTGPENLTTKADPQQAYKKAKVRPSTHDDAAVGEKIRLSQLTERVSGFVNRLTPAEKALFKKYPEKMQSCLSPAM